MTDILPSEALVAGLRVGTARSCGSCSLCCKLLKVDDPPFFKPAGKWCPHCRPGRGGCSIYDHRPALCRGWGCGWLLSSTLGDEWQPARCKMVVGWEVISDANEHAYCNIRVDPGTPDAWRREPYHSQIHAWALNGLRGVNGVTIGTRVAVGRRVFIILPDDDLWRSPTRRGSRSCWSARISGVLFNSRARSRRSAGTRSCARAENDDMRNYPSHSALAAARWEQYQHLRLRAQE